AVFEYSGSENHKFGIKYKGDHRVVYFGMGLEAIDSEENTSADDISPIRTEVLSRTLNWLNFIEHEPLSDTENLIDARTVITQVTNNIAISDLIGMELYWRKQNDGTFTGIPMIDIGNNQYRADIPGTGEIAHIEYYIKMVNSYYEWSNPQGAPQKFYRYYVGPDKIVPTFSHPPLASSINGENPRAVFVGIKDNIDLDTTAVYVHFRSKSISDSVKLMVGVSPGQFYGHLPAVFAYGDTVSYYFTAYDKSESPNRGQSAVFSFVVGYEDFESGLGNWAVSPEGWGLDLASAHSGNYSINDSPNQSPYPNNRDVNIATNFGIDLSNTEHAALKFWTRVFLEPDHDFGYLEISNDGGKTWTQLGFAFSGFIGTWKQHTVSLSNYCGSGNTDVRIRFRMVSDANQGPPVPGWFIDDVQIIEGLDVTPVAEDRKLIIPNRFALYQNYPNPFNPTTTIRFDLPVTGKVSIKIFNIKGELVRTLIEDQMNAGSHAIQWNSKDDSGQSLSSGVYFYKLSMNDFNATRKLLLIK
ncbi:MAG: T9SS type A sorting domain-containing protein, partial [bacterium]